MTAMPLGCEPPGLLRAAMAQSSIGIAVCDHDFAVCFFNAAISRLIDPAHCEIWDTASTVRGCMILRSLGVDDVSAALVALMEDGSWQDVIAQDALHVAIESFGDDNQAGGWLITAREQVEPSRTRMTERELIVGSSKLTPREREVMLALAEGASNKVIALRLGISPRTVEFHRAKIMHRFAAKSVVDLVRKVAADARSCPSMTLYDSAQTLRSSCDLNV